MPVPVRVFGVGGQQADIVLENTSNGQVIIQSVPFAITNISFNPKFDIISKNSTAVLGKEDFALLQEVKLYPNPVLQTLNLELPNNVTMEKAVFFNALGQTIKETTNEISWDVSSLPTGVNFVKVYTDSGVKQMKFIKA